MRQGLHAYESIFMCGVSLASTVWAPPSFTELGSRELKVFGRSVLLECEANPCVVYGVSRFFVFFQQHQWITKCYGSSRIAVSATNITSSHYHLWRSLGLASLNGRCQPQNLVNGTYCMYIVQAGHRTDLCRPRSRKATNTCESTGRYYRSGRHAHAPGSSSASCCGNGSVGLNWYTCI